MYTAASECNVAILQIHIRLHFVCAGSKSFAHFRCERTTYIYLVRCRRTGEADYANSRGVGQSVWQHGNAWQHDITALG